MYVKPTKTFKMQKQTKRLMCTLLSGDDMHSYKNAMIQAQLESERRPTKDKSQKDNGFALASV